jgi:DNA gyrase inhibitor GyrI
MVQFSLQQDGDTLMGVFTAEIAAGHYATTVIHNPHATPRSAWANLILLREGKQHTFWATDNYPTIKHYGNMIEFRTQKTMMLVRADSCGTVFLEALAQLDKTGPTNWAT